MSERSYYVSGTNNGSTGVYHFKRDCPYAPREIKEWPFEQVERAGYDCCKHCHPTAKIERGENSKSLRQRIKDGEIDLSALSEGGG